MPDNLKTGKGLIAFFDGSCWPNPNGKATCATIIQRDGVRMATLQLHVGTGPGMSNNVAEFAGIKLILDSLIEHSISESVTICGDSLIAIKRMKSRTLPTGLCREMATKCLNLARTCSGPVAYRWVPRELNAICDGLANFNVCTGSGIYVSHLTYR